MPSSALQAARWNQRRRRGRYSRGGRGFAFDIPPVTFPASALTARVQIALGADLSADWRTWNWLDITSRVRIDLGVAIDFGRRDQSSLVAPSVCLLKLTNTDGYLSRRNPVSPYFGLLSKSTPIWIQVNPGSGYKDRYFGYVNESAIRWSDQSGSDSYVLVRCAGILRRLAQGDEIDDSLDRTILADTPDHYWRVDDAASSAFVASSMPNGGKPMTVYAAPVFADLTGPPGGSDVAARMDAGSVFVENLSVSPPWTVEWSVLRPTNGTADGMNTLTATYLVSGVPDTIQTSLTADTAVSARDWYHYKVEAYQNGANAEVYWWKNGVSKGLAKTTPGTLGALTGVDMGNLILAAGVSGFGVGYLAAYSHLGVDAQTHSDALQAFNGELAHVRIARLCAEQGISADAPALTSAAMGPQPSGKLLDLLRECEAADGGLLYEHEFGIGYLALSQRCNQAVSLALDFHSRHIMGLPEPADDDQFTRNRWTITRPGSPQSVTAEQTTGAMGTGIDGIGVWPDQASLNVYADTQLAHEAGWRVHMGTVDEDRWPHLPLKMHGTPGLIPAWLAMPFGGRLTLSNPPPQMTPDRVDAVLEGYSERFDEVTWSVDLNTSPASPFSVAVLDDNYLGRLDSATSTLTSDVTDVATSISVTTTNAADLWTTDAAEVPFDIRVAGEQMTVTAVAGATSPQTFTVTRSVNAVITAHVAGAQVHVNQPAILAL